MYVGKRTIWLTEFCLIILFFNFKVSNTEYLNQPNIQTYWTSASRYFVICEIRFAHHMGNNSKPVFLGKSLSFKNTSRKMAAVDSASLSNGYGAQDNGHSYEDENYDKAFEENTFSRKPPTKAVPQKVCDCKVFL